MPEKISRGRVRGSTSIVFREDALLSDHKRQRTDEQLQLKNHPQPETPLGEPRQAVSSCRRRDVHSRQAKSKTPTDQA